MSNERFFDTLAHLDSLISAGQLAAAVNEVRRQQDNPTLQAYFFDRLHDGVWLEPLRQAGLFAAPPSTIHDQDRGTIAFPPWPAGQFLARMAKVSQLQPVVFEIAIAVPDTQNVRVHETLADIAISLPPAMAARFVAKAKLWIESSHHIVLPEKLASLIVHLAEGSQLDQSLDLARALLAIIPPRQHETDSAAKRVRLNPEPTGRFDVWQYEQVVSKILPALADAIGSRALLFFAELLETAVHASRQGAEPPQDYSWVWRPAIEEHEQNRAESVMNILVSALRDISERLAARRSVAVADLVSLLESHPWKVFHRVALHLLRRHPESAMALIEDRIGSRELFDDPGSRHEYVLLVAATFSRVSTSIRERILGWIKAGPDEVAYRIRHREASGQEPSLDDVARYANIWRRDRLAPLKDVLDTPWRRRYEEYVHTLGESEHTEFAASVAAGYVAESTPYRAADLRPMSVADIVALLTTWTPTRGWRGWLGPSRAGLGLEVASLVQAESERFSREADLFIGTHSTYVRSLIQGLADAIGEDRPIDWLPVLELCDWVLQQPRGTQEQSRPDEEDPDWGPARKAIATLLSTAFGKGTSRIGFAYRDRAWAVLRQLSDDPEPTAEYETKFGGSNMDPATLSINTVRGEAMHTVVRFALWVRRNIERASDGEDASGFTAMPQVREVLEAHLDLRIDRSLAIRAVYGQWFPQLVLLDRRWAINQLANIFPISADMSEYRDAAWQTYVVLCPPYDNVFGVLETEYSRAIDRIGIQPVRRILGDPDQRLAEHLMLLYGRGKISLESQGLVGQFYDRAPDQLRGHAISFVGRTLRDDNVSQDVLERFVRFWEVRLARIRETPSSSTEELSQFGWWFITGRFAEDWAIDQLEDSLALAGKCEPRHMIAQKLVEMAPRKPRQVVRCLKGLVESAGSRSDMLGWDEQAHSILRVAIRSNDVGAREAATDLVHRLGSLGHLAFRDLLETPSPTEG